MSGIAGFCNFNVNYQNNSNKWRDTLIAMRESMASRGKDSAGEFLGENIGLSHTRLSVKDLTTGIQPISRNIHGADYVIIFDGGIYNTDELRAGLSGFKYETATDAEVILYAYIHYGIDFAEKLNGVYAFAIWDDLLERLVLYRDRLGIKPLFYTIKDDTLVFGSEIKSLFSHPYVHPEIDMDSLRDIFGLGPARTSGNGVFKDIREVKSGCRAIFTREGFREEQYWDLVSSEHRDSYEETVENVAYLVRDAIKREIVSDIPICSFLSGGVDSSIVTAVASDLLNKSGVKLKTFSFDFKDNNVYFSSNNFQPEQDRPYVDLMLKGYDLDHTYLECSEEDLADCLFDAVDAKDLPGMADIDASLLYFCSLVKDYSKVALTGECSDEIFGGYPWFYRDELLNSGTFPWSRNIDVRTALLADDFVKSLELDGYVRERYDESLKAVPRLDSEPPDEQRRREVAYLNIKWFMQTLLDRMDRTGMFSGLEARVPFADHRIVEYVWNVPWEFKCKGGTVKGLLREAFKDILPPELLYRKKSPYPKTYNPNYERLLSERLAKIISDSNSPITPLINRDKILKFIKTPAEYDKPWFGQLMASPQLMAYIIQVNYWLGKYKLSLSNL